MADSSLLAVHVEIQLILISYSSQNNDICSF